MAIKESRTIYLHEEDFFDIGFGFDGPGQARKLNGELDTKKLFALCLEASERFGDDFTIIYDENIFFRGRKFLSTKGYIFAIREVFKGVPSLGEGVLNLPNYYKSVVLDEFLLSGGLFLICGSTGNGKSTTMAASVVERLKSYGGLAITVEDPPEYQMGGAIGKGYCFQMPVCDENGGDFQGAIIAALRAYPAKQRSTIMMIGEIRDSKTAAQVLRDSLNGHLVFSTVHSNDVLSGISRILSLASQEIGKKEAQELMSMAMRVVTHQKIINNKPKIQMLINDGSNSAIKSRLANGEIVNLGTELMRQNNLLLTGKLPIKEY